MNTALKSSGILRQRFPKGNRERRIPVFSPKAKKDFIINPAQSAIFC
jgi:hypothetical protein